jgi:hypothetical protein
MSHTLGYSRKAGTWVPTDTQNGEVSVAELQRKMKRDQQEASDWATSTWPRSNSLSEAQIKVLDGKNAIDNDRNAIGAPTSQERDEPRGFSSGVYTPKD